MKLKVDCDTIFMIVKWFQLHEFDWKKVSEQRWQIGNGKNNTLWKLSLYLLTTLENYPPKTYISKVKLNDIQILLRLKDQFEILFIVHFSFETLNFHMAAVFTVRVFHLVS